MDAKGNSYNTVSLIDYNGSQVLQHLLVKDILTATLAAASTDTSGTTGFIFSTGLADTFTLYVGSNSVTVSLTAAFGGSQTATALANVEGAIQSCMGN